MVSASRFIGVLAGGLVVPGFIQLSTQCEPRA